MNAGTGVYTAIQVNQLKTMVEGLQSLQIATLGVSLLGVGVSVAGFLYMRKRFNAVDERIDKLLDSVIEGFETQQKANLRAHLSQVKGLVQQAIQAHTLTNPQREYSRIAECLAGEAAHFEGELELVVKIHGKVNHELFWQLAQALMVCNSARIDCRIRTNELRNALTVSLGVAESYEGLFGRLTPLSFDIQSAQSEKTVTALKDITDVAATKPYLIDYLHSQRIDGPTYLGQLEQEEKQPLLMLKVAWIIWLGKERHVFERWGLLKNKATVLNKKVQVIYTMIGHRFLHLQACLLCRKELAKLARNLSRTPRNSISSSGKYVPQPSGNQELAN